MKIVNEQAHNKISKNRISSILHIFGYLQSSIWLQPFCLFDSNLLARFFATVFGATLDDGHEASRHPIKKKNLGRKKTAPKTKAVALPLVHEIS